MKEVLYIRYQKQIVINALPEKIFALIETMPNKFPVYKILETRPFFFIRILLVDGLRSAIKTVSIKKPNDVLVLQVGDLMGPFRLTEVKKPFKYWFTLKSFFFNCRTGYSLRSNESGTILSFDLISDNPRLTEKVYWFFIKPLHVLLANKVLKVIKGKVESESSTTQ